MESAFFPDGAPEAFRGLIAPFYQMERALAFVASVEGRLVACGTGLIIPEHRVFALCGAGTLAGISRTRSADRLAACSHGGRRLRRDANMPLWSRRAESISQRNAERLGFRVAYSKVTVIKPLDS